MSGLGRELEVALAAADEAARAVLTFWRTPLDVQTKPGDEPVTAADHAANDVVVARLRAAFPADALLSEELPDDGSRMGARRVWMVDPIDGTRDFINGEEGFAVMIGLVLEGRPALGVVLQPSTGVVWAGTPDGAFRQEGDGARRPLRVSTRSGPPGIRLVASKSHRSPDIDAFRAALGISDETNTGSVGLKMGLVAEARCDLYLYTGTHTKLWDSAAPEAILTAAGGRVTDVHGRPLVYDAPDLVNHHGILASNRHLHDLSLGALRGVLAPPPPA